MRVLKNTTSSNITTDIIAKNMQKYMQDLKRKPLESFAWKTLMFLMATYSAYTMAKISIKN